MKLPGLSHIDLGRLEAFATGEIAAGERETIAAHLRGCPRCQDALRFVRRLETTASEIATPAPREDVMERALAARAAGERRILPAVAGADPEQRTAAGRYVRWASAAAILLVSAALLLRPSDQLAAVDGRSTMRLTPAQPQPGATIRVEYAPAPGLFVGEDSLVVRARMRVPSDGMYEVSVPPERTAPVATLRRGAGGAFRGEFALPDTIVFAALAVEDLAARRVDDDNGRLWEVVMHAADGRPDFDALQQRANDMMGRSWEEGYATARRLTDLYPERFAAWTLREFFERAILGEDESRALVEQYRGRIDSLVELAKARPTLSYPEIGTVFYRRFVAVRFGSPTAADSAEAEYWWERIRREYPRHPQIAQRRALDLATAYREQPLVLLDSLERAYGELAPLDGPGRNVIHTAGFAAERANDSTALRRWAHRSLAGSPDSAFRAALVDVSYPAHRRGAMVSLRRFLDPAASGVARPRGLTETAAAYGRREQNARRRALVALGRALLAEGERVAALDTLRIAARGGWDPAVFREVSSASIQAGDTATALAMAARIAVDPRSKAAAVDSVARLATAVQGETAWGAATERARREMHASYLERSDSRPVRGAPRVATLEGRLVPLRELTAREPAVVIFWSRRCGAALEALPEIVATVARLERERVKVLVIADDDATAETAEYLRKQNLSGPIYFDRGGSAATAFSNFGTPRYYVVDGAGQIRFDRVSELPELFAQIGALRSEGAPTDD